MKAKVLLELMCSALTASAFTQGDNISIDRSTFGNLLTWVQEVADSDKNGLLSYDEAMAVTRFSESGEARDAYYGFDSKGIGYFENLEEIVLDFPENHHWYSMFLPLDLSSLPNLKRFVVYRALGPKHELSLSPAVGSDIDIQSWGYEGASNDVWKRNGYPDLMISNIPTVPGENPKSYFRFHPNSAMKVAANPIATNPTTGETYYRTLYYYEVGPNYVNNHESPRNKPASLLVVPGDVVALDEENFPDPNFREWVSRNADADRDGILTYDEMGSIYSLVNYEVEETERYDFWMDKHFLVNKEGEHILSPDVELLNASQNLKGIEYLHNLRCIYLKGLDLRSGIDMTYTPNNRTFHTKDCHLMWANGNWMGFDLEIFPNPTEKDPIGYKTSTDGVIHDYEEYHSSIIGTVIYDNGYFKPVRFFSYNIDEEKFDVALEDDCLDLTQQIAAGMDLNRITSLKGAKIEGNKLHFLEDEVSYNYFVRCAKNRATFTCDETGKIGNEDFEHDTDAYAPYEIGIENGSANSHAPTILLKVTLEANNFVGVEKNTIASPADVKITGNGLAIHVEGGNEASEILVASPSGSVVYRGHSRAITLPSSGIYIVRVGATIKKIKVAE